jgi:hypothetical protein
VADWKAEPEIIAVFHTNAGHVTLHDKSYNLDRNTVTGNSYKDLIADLVKRGVQIELCGATASVYGSASRNQGQHGRNGENDAARSGTIRQNL